MLFSDFIFIPKMFERNTKNSFQAKLWFYWAYYLPHKYTYLQGIQQTKRVWHDLFVDHYKICQDHLENFFSCIRIRGGFNNNPNSWQFRVAYRHLIVQSGIVGRLFLQLDLTNDKNCLNLKTIKLYSNRWTSMVISKNSEPLGIGSEVLIFPPYHFSLS